MTRRKCPRPVGATLAAFKEPVEHDNACSRGYDESYDPHVTNHAPDDGDVMLRQVQLEMLIAPLAENLACLDDLRRQTVAVHWVVLTIARLYELWGDAQQLQVPLLLDSVSA